ncbi:MAG: hypothetical protein IJS46_04565, partial [Kiritimatiellae bacterium]|nr:hypothetical protein [Kiritimatiellia bacterium]
MNALHAIAILLSGLCFAGLSWAALRCAEKAAGAYGAGTAAATARGLEDIFLFVPPHRVAEMAAIMAAVSGVLVFLAAGGVAGSPMAI